MRLFLMLVGTEGVRFQGSNRINYFTLPLSIPVTNLLYCDAEDVGNGAASTGCKADNETTGILYLPQDSFADVRIIMIYRL